MENANMGCKHDAYKGHPLTAMEESDELAWIVGGCLMSVCYECLCEHVCEHNRKWSESEK